MFFAIWAFFFRNFAQKQGLGGMMSIGKSRAKIYVEKETGVTFADIAGVEEAKAELKEIVDFLKKPEDYGRLGRPHSKGHSACGAAWYRQNAVGARSCR